MAKKPSKLADMIGTILALAIFSAGLWWFLTGQWWQFIPVGAAVVAGLMVWKGSGK